MKKILILAILVFLIFAGLGSMIGFYTDLLWFESMGFEEAFWTMYTTEYVVGFVFFILTVFVFWFNYYLTRKAGPEGGYDFLATAPPQIAKMFVLAGWGLLLLVCYHLASWAAGKWMLILQYFHSQPFGQTDAIFENDIGFYVFELPAIQGLINYIFVVLILNIIAVSIVYLFKRGIYFSPTGMRFGTPATRHILILCSLILVLYIWDYYYSAYNILYNEQGVVFGAGYADVYASLPGYRIMSVIAGLAAIMTALGAIKARWKYLAIAFAVWIGAVILVLGIYPSLIQKFVVTPNALEKERPYIQENILKTRAAYQLDRIQEKDFPYEQNLTAEDLKDNAVTVKNITLWDYRPLKDSYSQLQEIRPYYMFNDIDIDRYTLNGEYRQVMLAGRELNLSKINRGENWINQTFIYTHGHGIVMSPVNRVSREGQPEFFIKNIPPESSVDLQLNRPEIYFGEMQDPEDYIIVKTSKEEFDYPIGESNQHTFYKEESGIDIGSFGRKLLFAIRFQKMGILLNDYIQDTSKIIYYRNIVKRMRMIAPYLKFDADPYLAIADGRLYWICDAYTTTNRYPYSRRYIERSDDAFYGGESFNYIRNSVKVVIDAYNGKTVFYAFNPEDDPLIRVYASIFKGVYKPIQDMPASIRHHIRYPQDLFDIQARLFSVYHVENVNVFFNREDIWNIAEEKYANNTQTMESYYMIMRLPGEPKEEFMLMVPYTPNAKANMIAWLCVRSDGENYGKMLVYRFPKSELIYGPNQIEARIDQTPDISEKLTLWNQQGSRVTRGNMIVVPIKNSILYVEPLYLQSEQSKMPELKKVIVAYANSIAMEDNLDMAIDKIFGSSLNLTGREQIPLKTSKTTGKEITDPAMLLQTLRQFREISRSALDNYRRSQESIRSGNWSKYGEDLERLRKDLEKLNELQKGN